MITNIAKVKAQPGKEAALAEECIKLAKEVRNTEKGCTMCIPHVSTENPAKIVIVERFVDQNAFDSHFQTPQFKAIAEKFGELLDGPPVLLTMKKLI